MSNVNTLPPAEVQAGEAAEAKAAEKAAMESPAERRSMTVAQQKYYDALEARGVPGARVLTPKQQLMDTSDLERQNPDRSYRWVNTSNTARADSRKLEGYEVYHDAEGKDRRLGEFVLMEIPRVIRERKVAQINQVTQDRLGTFQRDMQQAVENVARELRDRHGIRVDTKRLLVNEG